MERIIIVDDNIDVSKKLKSALSSFKVEHYSTIEYFFECIEDGFVDLTTAAAILCDYQFSPSHITYDSENFYMTLRQKFKYTGKIICISIYTPQTPYDGLLLKTSLSNESIKSFLQI